jgi:hypothetical protein
VSLVCAAAAFAVESVFVAGAAKPAAEKMPAPSIKIKQPRSPGNFPRTETICNCVTGKYVCMKNTALDGLAASSRCCYFGRTCPADSAQKTPLYRPVH